MNYFAHGRRFVEEPYLLAGTALPDWLSVVDRKLRVRSKAAAPLSADPDGRLAAVAEGVLRHLEDDAWFHETRAFAELSLEFSAMIREALPDDDGLRPSFLGHILVELLLDARLIEDDPEQIEAYYAALGSVDPVVVAEAVRRMTGRDAARVAMFIPHFRAERFLLDYRDDTRLWFRLNQVMRRVGLPLLPETFCEVLPAARVRVAERTSELLTRLSPRPIPTIQESSS